MSNVDNFVYNLDQLIDPKLLKWYKFECGSAEVQPQKHKQVYTHSVKWVGKLQKRDNLLVLKNLKKTGATVNLQVL